VCRASDCDVGPQLRIQAIMTISHLLGPGALAVGLILGPATVCTGQNPASRITGAVRAAVIDTAVAQLARIYVDADTAQLIGAALRRRAAAGAYDGLDEPAQFAEALTRDLRSVNGDLHLSLRWARGGDGPTRQGLGRPTGNQVNYGMGRAEILDGNVGYLEITSFGFSGYEDAVADALRFLSRTDALILDVRRNGGGSSDMSHFIFSHFFGPEPIPTIRVQRRSPPEVTVRRTLAQVPGPRRPDVPLFLLTSRFTGSAAEEFSFVLKNRHRATLVGTRTAGAGHMVAFVPAGEGFVLGLSITRVSDPETGREWERVGVQPDIAVAAEQALPAAHAAALRAILASTTDTGRARVLTRVLAAVEAQTRPQTLDEHLLASYTGNYEGRVVGLSNGRLCFARRDGGLCEPLVRLEGNRFALGATQLVFEPADGAMQLTVETPDGSRLRLTRGLGAAP